VIGFAASADERLNRAARSLKGNITRSRLLDYGPEQPMEVKMEYRDKNIFTEWKETPDSGVKVETDYQCYAFLLIPSPGDDNQLAHKRGTVLVSARSEADARVVASQGETEAFRGQVAIGDTDLTTNDFSAFRNEKSYQVHRVSDEPIDTPRGIISIEGTLSHD